MFPKIHSVGNTIIIRYNGKVIVADPESQIDVRPDIILVSHAHSDHISHLRQAYKPGVKVILSSPTYRILRLLGYSFRDDDLLIVLPGDVLDLYGITFKIFNAGHIVGSIMFEIDFNSVKVGFTGDFNFEGSNILPPADVMDVDILLLDATYGKPIYSFPPREILYRIMWEKLKELLEEDGKTLVFQGYALGKGQELTKFASDYLGTSISVDKSVAMYNKIYESEFSKPLGRYEIGSNARIYIHGMHRKNLGKNALKIVFTGWVINKVSSRRIGFPLSSHNSFTKLVDYLLKASPDFVYVAYGKREDFSKFLIKEMGIPAKPLPEVPEEMKIRIKRVG